MRHINDESFEKIENLSEECLLHIASCPKCAEKMAAQAQRTELFAPRGFSENVKHKIKRKRQELFMYSLRVGVASAAAVALVMTNVFLPKAENFGVKEDLTKQIGETLKNLNFGGDKYEKTAK